MGRVLCARLRRRLHGLVTLSPSQFVVYDPDLVLPVFVATFRARAKPSPLVIQYKKCLHDESRALTLYPEESPSSPQEAFFRVRASVSFLEPCLCSWFWLLRTMELLPLSLLLLPCSK
jgi:hypothetical protein